VAFHDPLLRDVEQFDAYREALRKAAVGDAPTHGGRSRRTRRRRSSSQARDAARLRAERDFNARLRERRDDVSA
jgi:hypothetical protein